jgi:thymidylate kinase
MFSVALIGPDGAGKSTIANMLAESFPVSVKVLYMGINLDSSNVMLPTSRLIRRVKKLGRRKSGAVDQRTGQPKARKASGGVRAVFRLGNRLAEEWYRQIMMWKYQRNGAIVICDRHFQFDFDYGVSGPDGVPDQRLTERLHRWCLAKLYPSPDLTILLDAPGEVLFARKAEATVDWLESRRQALLQQGEKLDNFIAVDTTKPLDAVYKEVSNHILNFYKRTRPAQKLMGQAAA